MPIRLIVSDLDDTLLSHDRLTERTLSALERAMAHGIKVVLASGRMVESMTAFADQAKVNAPIIAYNGGVTYDTVERRIIRQSVLPADVARELCQLAEESGVHVQCYQGGGFFFAERNGFSDDYGEAVGVYGEPVHQPLSRWIAGDSFKVLMIDSAQRVSELLPVFRDRFEGRVNCLTSKPYYLECVAPGCDKAVALAALAESYGIPPSDILAFGDGLNDIEMLRYAGHGHAMANASEAVRNSVPNTAPPCDEDGVAQVIERVLDGGKSHVGNHRSTPSLRATAKQSRTS